MKDRGLGRQIKGAQGGPFIWEKVWLDLYLSFILLKWTVVPRYPQGNAETPAMPETPDCTKLSLLPFSLCVHILVKFNLEIRHGKRVTRIINNKIEQL